MAQPHRPQTDASTDGRRAISRRTVLQAALATGAGAALGSVVSNSRAQPQQPAELATMVPQLTDVRDRIHRTVRQWVDKKQLARADGFIYTVDAAHLLIYFAQSGDAQGYAAMREHAVRNLIRDDRADSYTQGFVSWRWKEGEKLDASGTTEALRVAEGLWRGAKAFDKPQDADLALKVLGGYARHAAVDQGVWIIRNYFGFGTRSFATNSFLVDYDPDFVAEVAGERKDAELQQLADKCYGVVKLAPAPSGLLYDLIQPEVKTLYPELNLAAFSPNDVIQLSNCATTAMTVARGLAPVARKVLAFALNRMEDLRVYYYGRTGEPVNDKPGGLFEYSTLARLAARLGATQATATIAQRGMPSWTWFADHPDPRELYMSTEVLLAMQTLLAMKDANTKPPQQ